MKTVHNIISKSFSVKEQKAKHITVCNIVMPLEYYPCPTRNLKYLMKHKETSQIKSKILPIFSRIFTTAQSILIRET